MLAFAARRLLLGLGVLLAVSLGTFAFFATRFGSPVTGPTQTLAPNAISAVSLWWSWLARLAHGDTSTALGANDVGGQTWQSLGHTAALLGSTAVLVAIFATLLGILSATRAGTRLDLSIRSFSYVAWAVPGFLVALLLQSAFRWMSGRSGFHPFALEGWPGQCNVNNLILTDCGPVHGGITGYALAFVRHLALPATALAVAFIGVHSRYLRSSLLVALAAPYTRTARAKGLPERTVVLRHALRNSLAAFLSVMLLDFAAVFGAAMAIDFVFQLGGLGTLFLFEIQTSIINPYAVQLLLTVTAGLVIASALLSELVVCWLDPRARLM